MGPIEADGERRDRLVIRRACLPWYNRETKIINAIKTLDGI
jgi:hypothetical protein